MKHPKIALLLLAAVLCSMLATSCNTFRGFGRDVQHTGHHIQRAAS